MTLIMRANGFLTAIALASLAGGAACGSSSGNAPKAEVVETQIKLDLPAPPEFPMPQPLADGSHSVAEMRLRSPKFLDQAVKVTGYVITNYNMNACAHEVGAKLVKENESLCAGKGEFSECSFKVGQKAVTETPNLCNRPHFYLADTPSASLDKAILVSDVPRGIREDEKKDQFLVDEFKKKGPPPDLDPLMATQTQVAVTGKWQQKSPLGFTNSDGLLVFESITPDKPLAPAPAPK
jgi:hypothetical protein